MTSADNAFKFGLETAKKLIKIKLLTPLGMSRFAAAAMSEGVNLMLLLKWAAQTHGKRIALTDERESVSFSDLYNQSLQLANVFQNEYGLKNNQKAAFVCRNHASLVRALFGASRLGADVFLLNAEISEIQFQTLLERHAFSIVIYDEAAENLIKNCRDRIHAIPAYHANLPSVDSLSKSKSNNAPKLNRGGSGNVIVMTGGTTGQPKAARRKPSVINFLNPFFALLVKLNLDRYKSVYVATPAYHGFGLAAVFLSVLLGIRMYFLARFEAQSGCDLIEKEQIEVVTLVPLMLSRMLVNNTAALPSLRCVVTGGAPINSTLVEKTFNSLGDVLFNLYGTSEAGFSIMATPADLRRDSRMIGRKIIGVKLKILDAENHEMPPLSIGRMCIKSRWSIGERGGWVETGDVGYQDREGFYFHCGRADEMVVSAGEKVYPIELETILMKHPNINQVAVIGIADAEFGQRLKAFIVPAPSEKLDEKEIFEWLTSRAARFQMPKSIVIQSDLPVTAIGKINKKALS